MAERPVAFDEPTARSLLGLLRERRVERAPLRQEVPASAVTTRRHRWAKATTNYLHPTYPTSGNVILVEFGEQVFTPPTATGETVAPVWTPYGTSPYDEGSFALAVVPDGGTLPAEGEIVRVDLDDGIWWVRPSGGGTTWPVITCNLLIDYINGGGSYIDETHSAGWYVEQYYGDVSDIGFAVNGSRASASDWTFSLTNPGRYLWLIDWYGEEGRYTGTGTKTYTTSTPSAGASHTHTVTVDVRYSLRGQLWLERQAGGSGGWDNGVPDFATHGVYQRWVGKTWHYPPTDGTESYEGDPVASASICEAGITANDRFRLTTYAWPDTQCVADQGASKFRLYYGETWAQLTIVRIGDSPSILP